MIARLFYPYAGFQRTFGTNLEPEWQDSDAMVICVNTTRASRHKDGEVSAEQILRVSQRLATATSLHARHHLPDVPERGERGAFPLLQLLRQVLPPRLHETPRPALPERDVAMPQVRQGRAEAQEDRLTSR